MSDLTKGRKSLQTTINMKKLLPSFYNKEKDNTEPKKLAWGMRGTPPELLLAFDIESEWPENFGTLCAAKGVATSFIDAAVADGYTNDLCSYLLNTMGYLAKSKELGGIVPPESPTPHGLGNPDMLLSSGYLCEPRYKWFQAVATRFNNIPVHCIDPLGPPVGIDVHDPEVEFHYTEMLRRDLAAEIKFLEEQTDKKLDIDRLRVYVKNSFEAEKYFYKSLELCKATPCPISAVDYFNAIIPELYMMGTKEAVTFYKAMYEEIKDRVDKGIGIVQNEKHRIIFVGIPPWFNMGFFNYLENMGVAIPLNTMYYIGKPADIEVGDDPVEALVQRTWAKTVWNHDHSTDIMPESLSPCIGTPSIGTELYREYIRDYKIDGVIMNCVRTCRSASFGQQYLRQIFDKEGIPSLIFESDMADPRQWSDAKIKGLVEAYIETLDRK